MAGPPWRVRAGAVTNITDERSRSETQPMAILPILTLPHPILRRKAVPVAAVDARVRKLAADMLETMYDAPGVGLAAPQIGVSERLIVCDCAVEEDAEPTPFAMVNPEIVWSSEETKLHEEGCLSIPDMKDEVERPASVRVRYTDLDGQVREIAADGLLAVCLQHEIDHLDGVLFIDHLSRLKRDRIVKKFEKAARLARDKETSLAG